MTSGTLSRRCWISPGTDWTETEVAPGIIDFTRSLAQMTANLCVVFALGGPLRAHSWSRSSIVRVQYIPRPGGTDLQRGANIQILISCVCTACEQKGLCVPAPHVGMTPVIIWPRIVTVLAAGQSAVAHRPTPLTLMMSIMYRHPSYFSYTLEEGAVL